jgi:hypothetical protein
MDEFLVGETLRLLRWRTELLEIMNGPDADRRIRSWLTDYRRAFAGGLGHPSGVAPEQRRD